MGLTINNMPMHEAAKAIKHESSFLKFNKLCSAFITLSVAVIACSLMLTSHSRAADVTDHCLEILPSSEANTAYCGNSTFYDWAFLTKVNQKNFSAYFSDETEFKQTTHMLNLCIIDPVDSDPNCLLRGTRWSYVFPLFGWTMLLFVFQGILLTVGVWYFPTRVIALTLQPFLWCLNLGVVVTTAVFRFNSMGRLASISLSPVHYEVVDGVATLTDERLYQDDGQLLFRLWVTALIFIFAQCCMGCFAAAPPTQEKLRKMGIFSLNENEPLRGVTISAA